MSKKRISTIYDYAKLCESMNTCHDCPFGKFDECFGDVLAKQVDEYNDIILKWCDEHPAKTYLDDYLEKLPNCKRVPSTKLPVACINNAYGLSMRCSDSCSDCWNQPMEGSDEQ